MKPWRLVGWSDRLASAGPWLPFAGILPGLASKTFGFYGPWARLRHHVLSLLVAARDPLGAVDHRLARPMRRCSGAACTRPTMGRGDRMWQAQGSRGWLVPRIPSSPIKPRGWPSASGTHTCTLAFLTLAPPPLGYLLSFFLPPPLLLSSSRPRTSWSCRTTQSAPSNAWASSLAVTLSVKGPMRVSGWCLTTMAT